MFLETLRLMLDVFKVDKLQIIVVAKNIYLRVVTVTTRYVTVTTGNIGF